MIQFLGLAFSNDRVDVVSLGRDLGIAAERSTPILNVRKGAAETIVHPAEWVRAAGYLLQETYLDLPVPLRKVWGVGLAGPAGWIALDLDYRPLGDIRLVPPPEVAPDVRRWLETEPRLAKRVAALLSPKDYFRFAISGSLASDVTLASRQSLAASGGRSWDRRRIEAAGIDPRWLPPVFDAEVRTGQITREGIERTGLPPGVWMVAGALLESSAQVASCDLREGKLWAPADAPVLAYGLRDLPRALPDGFRAVRPAYSGCWALERDREPGSGEAEDVERARRALEDAGLEVGEIVRCSGRPEAGAAAIAAVGSGLIKSWDILYRKARFLNRPS